MKVKLWGEGLAKPTTCDCFDAVGREAVMLSTRLRGKLPAVCEVNSDVVLERVVQRIVQLILPAYAHSMSSKVASEGGFFPEATCISGAGISLTTGAGKVSVSTAAWFIFFSGFVVNWVRCLWAIIGSYRPEENIEDAILLFGVSEESIFRSETDRDFVEFCERGPVSILNGIQRVYAESSGNCKQSSKSNFIYVDRPHLRLIRDLSGGVKDRLLLALRHIWTFPVVLFLLIKSPLLALAATDLAYCVVMRHLDVKKRIRAAVLTCSNVAWQPLWVRSLKNAKSHMIWYAQNWRPIRYKTDRSNPVNPHLSWMGIDVHWVWTKQFGDYIQSLHAETNVRVCGPIIWYLPKSRSMPQKSQVTIFDVPAYSQAVATGNGELCNYCSPENLQLFIDDVVSVSQKLSDQSGVTLKLCLKIKRNFASDYDRGYFDYVRALSDSGRLHGLPIDTDLFALISSSALVVAYPFTSPGYIAEALGVPFLYYDPTCAIVPSDFSESQSSSDTFAAGFDELYRMTLSRFTSHLGSIEIA